jgi:anhydro-N-acetylmuramic acid kinase
MGKYRRKTAQSPRRGAAIVPGLTGPVIGAGLMSGTSADGIDVAIVRFSPAPRGLRLRLLGFRTAPYPKGFRSFLLKNSDSRTADLAEISTLNVLVAEFFSDALLGLAASLDIDPGDISFAGSHGQTICHLPGPTPAFGRRVRSTLQVGSPSLIAKRTGIVTVGDFRAGDVALGGSGAPLVPICDYLFYRDGGRNRAALNIGGIANITVIPRACPPGRVSAFDTGPGNMLIDRVVSALYGKACDQGGAIALRGRIIPALLSRLAAHPYIRTAPPKSTGREMFGDALAGDILRRSKGERKEDVVATVTEFTAMSVYANCLLHVPRKDFPEDLIVSGGGAHNAYLVEALMRYFHPARVSTADDWGIPSDAKEAVCFALLAWRTLKGLPGNIPSVTGALRPTPLGVICLP